MTTDYPYRPSSGWPWPLPGPGRHFVYRLCALIPGVDPVEASADVYVGVTSNLRQRMDDHARKWWWPAVVPDMCELLEFDSRAEAEVTERQMIMDLQPAMNRAGRVLLATPL